MAYVAVDTQFHNHPTEFIFRYKPKRDGAVWVVKSEEDYMALPKGSIKKLIGRELSWEDEPVELKGESDEAY